MRNRLPVLLLSVAVSVASAAPVHVLKLSPHRSDGAPSKTYRFRDGTVLTNTLFYQSKASGLSVGRSYVNGPLMPRETADYTDMFMVAHGSGSLVESSGKAHQLVAGDFVLLPRGLTFELRDARDYIHYFASFDRQKGAGFEGPITLKLLHPGQFCRNDLARSRGGGHHTYYEGHGGVIISAYRYPDSVQDRGTARRSYSELMFVVSGSGTVQESGQASTPLTSGAAIFIPKDTLVRLDARNLCVLSVQFDRSEATTRASVSH